MKRLLLAAGCLSLENVAWANNPPAPETLVGMISIMPMALLFFSLSGAGELEDRLQPGRKRVLGRLTTLVLATLVCLLSGAHEAWAVLVSVGLVVWAGRYASKSIRLSRELPPGSSRRRAMRCGGYGLWVVVVLLGSLSLVFFGRE